MLTEERIDCAIEDLKLECANYMADLYCWDEAKTKCSVCHIPVAIEALEKQMPKEPIKSDREISYCEVWKCPNCGFEWSSRVVDYCYRCGQAILWEDK